jgi:hypothetical protein
LSNLLCALSPVCVLRTNSEQFFIRKAARSGYTFHVGKMFVALFILAVAVALILVGCKVTRAGYESAPYKVLRSSGKFEVRDYPALTVVETPMAGGGDTSSGSPTPTVAGSHCLVPWLIPN